MPLATVILGLDVLKAHYIIPRLRPLINVETGFTEHCVAICSAAQPSLMPSERLRVMFFVVDVESNGPCPGLFSMISFGAVAVDDTLDKVFLGKVAPLPGAARNEQAASICGVSSEEHSSYENPQKTMRDFAEWIKNTNKNGRPIFVSDNPAFDWQFINYYFHMFLGENPFGFSAKRIGDLYAGLTKDYNLGWKKFRTTSHDHNPVNDAKGNAEALIKLARLYKIQGVPCVSLNTQP